MAKYSLGVLPSPPDKRDYKIARVTPVKVEFPEEYLITGDLISVYDQGAYGMCVAYTLKLMKEHQERQERNILEPYSAGYIYGNRASGHYQGEGMYPREALSQLVSSGVCSDALLSERGTFEQCRDRITEQMHQNAEPQQIKTYLHLYSADEIKTALMELGPVMFALPVYSTFDSPENGIIKVPDVENDQIRGYHAITCIGWTKENRWVIQNSWSASWGDNGRAQMDFGYPLVEVWSATDKIAEPEPEPNPEPGTFRAKFWDINLDQLSIKFNGSRTEIVSVDDTGIVTFKVVPEGILVVDEIHADAPGRDKLNLSEEYIRFKNVGQSSISMTGYILQDKAGHLYRFPTGFNLAINSTVSVRTGEGTDNQIDLYWNSTTPIWNNKGDVIIVRNADGTIILEVGYSSNSSN